MDAVPVRTAEDIALGGHALRTALREYATNPSLERAAAARDIADRLRTDALAVADAAGLLVDREVIRPSLDPET